MRARFLGAAQTPSLIVILCGHAAAGVVFSLAFQPLSLRPIWLPQFFILLCIATGLLLAALRTRKNLHRIFMLLSVVIIETVMGIPQGPDLSVDAILGTVFIFIATMEVQGRAAAVLCIAAAVALTSTHWPLAAWGTRIEGANPVSAALLAAYFLFLTWLAGLVGNRGHQIRRQNEEILRIDATVRALSEANLDFQELATRVQRETEEQERKRLAREIHDIVGHTLMNIQMMMEAATDLARNRREGLEDLLVKSRNQAQRGLLETRRAMRNLREVSKVQATGMRRIAELARIFENATAVSVRLHLGNAPASFGVQVDDAVYRMIQECLTNALRHGNATEITVSFWVVENAVRLSVVDNGAGAREIVPGIGLAGMGERIAHLGGAMKAENTAFGFLVSADIPLAQGQGT
ncbi:MAG: sensor histidine kinase [Spirochaetia bacterium]